MFRFLFFIVLISFFKASMANTIDPKKPIIFTYSEKVNDYTTRIPFKLIDHLIVVEAELYDVKGNFIIDTGSETMILNSVHFQGLYGVQKKSSQSYGVNEAIDNPQEKKVKDFVIKNFSLESVNSDVINLSHIEKSKKLKLLGIIGYNVLKDYEIFIDLHLNQMTLSKVDKYGNTFDKNVYLEKITDSLDFKLKNHTISLKVDINGNNLTFGLDTAAEYNQINKNLNRKILKSFIPKKRLTLIGASNREIEVMAGSLHRVKLSKTIYFGPMDTILTNLNNMNGAFGTHLDGVLGYEFFKQRRTIINYQKEKLYFIDYPLIRN